MRIAIPALTALAALACADHHPSAQRSGAHRLLSPAGPMVIAPPQVARPGITCLLSTAKKCAELMAQAPPHLCLLATGRCPSAGSVVPLARLEPR